VVSPSMIQATLGHAGPHIELVYRQGHPC
jgi:hypothetical protein